MRKFIQMFVDSAGEFKKLKSVILAALLLAVHMVLTFYLSIPVTDTLKISVAFVVNCVIGLLYGPVMAFVCGGVGDVIGYLIKPMGPFFPGFTISAALAGLVYGIAFYRKYPRDIQSKRTDTESYTVNDKPYRMIPQILLAVGILFWFLVPFLTVTAKASKEQTEEIIFNGSALLAVQKYFSGKDAVSTSAILALLMLSVLVALFVLNFTKRTLIALLVSVFGACGIMLSVYTDKNTVKGEYGFYLLVGILCICVLFNIMLLMYQRLVDAGYMFRCFIAMTMVAVFINSILGTYWLTIMYGKGFSVLFTVRVIKNLIQLPINTVLVYLLMCSMKRLQRRMKF